MKQKIAKLEAVALSYSSGVIPKENIYFRKCLQVPEDVSVNDLSMPT